ncbi:hypothetical protein CERSUDRAFT_113385 [Gelatoporia subvermispora B]|uniref:SET domain-containing protein n=1 Tax=Ceriporiopsis subvermispora (strain B) TaxID=914234 RepID=M2RIC6_CERS8|nr:hypothetical protein CERSUDRAFT_113385 [Gelatoporia subvermispora B]
MTNERLPILLRWLCERDIQIDDSIRVLDDPVSGISVVSTDKIIESASTIAWIPKSAILSVRSCSLAPNIPFAPYGHDAHLALSTALYAELLRGSASQWYGYLQSLPIRTVPLALFWGVPETACDDEDGEQARLWITNTQVEKELVTDTGTIVLDDIRNYYHSSAKPMFDRYHLHSTLLGFHYAYSLVSSRAFLVDSYHGLSMVPIADAFNHVNENHVHLESNYDVCPICGSLSECPHDTEEKSDIHMDEDGRRYAYPSIGVQGNDVCEMVVNRIIPPHMEIFNTYGSRLGNAALLARYGFSLEGNDNDMISFDLSSNNYQGSALSRSCFQQLLYALAQAWNRGTPSMITEESSLVFQPDLDATEEQEDVASPLPFRSLLYINSDAQISVHLWLFAALRRILADRHLANIYLDRPTDGNASWKDSQDAARLLAQAMQLQIQVEQLLAADDEDRDIEEVTVSKQLTYFLSGVAREVCLLCSQKAQSIGKSSNLSIAELGDLLDGLDDNYPKTRLAISQVILERSLLESCEASWRELGDAIAEE